jgi:Holliday junction resolvase RusA-like endonuclease
MATGVVYTPAKTKNYEETVKWCYQMAAHGARFPDNEPLSMLVVAYRPIPKSASAKKKSLMRAGAERPITKPDWDNVGKIVSDALNGIAYRDDSQIVDARVVKRYSDNPMVKVSVWLTNDTDTSRWVNG